MRLPAQSRPVGRTATGHASPDPREITIDDSGRELQARLSGQGIQPSGWFDDILAAAGRTAGPVIGLLGI
jgi:hypothetical protein